METKVIYIVDIHGVKYSFNDKHRAEEFERRALKDKRYQTVPRFNTLLSCLGLLCNDIHMDSIIYYLDEYKEDAIALAKSILDLYGEKAW